MPRSAAAAIAALLIGSAACTRAVHQTEGNGVPAPRVDSLLAVATFDSAWSRIRSTYYDSTFHGLDWRAVGDELRGKAARARDMNDVRAAIEGLFEHLGESHFDLVPAEVVERTAALERRREGEGSAPGDVGVEIRMLNGEAIVSRVEQGSPAAAGGVRAGWTIEAIDGERVDSLIGALRREWGATSRGAMHEVQLPLTLMSRLRGDAGRSLGLVLRDDRGRRIERVLNRHPARGEVVRYGHLPPQIVRLEGQRIDDAGECVGVIRFNVWMTAIVAPLDSAMGELGRCRGIVLDLRGNVGGVAAMVMGVGGYFLDSAYSLGTTRSRGVALRYMVNPRRVASGAAFAGALAILVDGLSASTSEIFTAGMQEVGRARVFGARTAGQALPATLVRLPNGDVMLHVIADFTTAGGRRLEGAGVTPDELVPLSPADLLAARDAPLEAALRWISHPPVRAAASATAGRPSP